MALLDIRQRAGYLFLAVMVGHVILISSQVNAQSGVPVLKAVTFGAFAEVQRAASSIVGGVRRFWTGYVDLRQVRGENERLRSELAAAQIQLQEQRARAERSRRLESLLALRDRLSLETTAAEVIASSASPDFQTFTIDKGTADGVEREMAVLAPAGVVGRVVVPSPRASRVQMLIDKNAAAGGAIERSRAQALVVGNGAGLALENVPDTADIVVGDVVVTSGIEGIFPKGFVIGRVASVKKSGVAYDEIVIEPAVDFTSLEEVLVVLTPAPAREAGVETAP
jgi:rod shape-determining protein MreC